VFGALMRFLEVDLQEVSQEQRPKYKDPRPKPTSYETFLALI
jgi:hypothetical protein